MAPGSSRGPGPDPRGAGVPVDPQVIYGLPLVAGLLLHRWHPAHVLPPGLAAPVGVALVAAGLLVAWSAVRQFRRARTSLQPREPSTALITEGPYRFTRNPIYLAFTLLYASIGFWVNTVWPFAFLPFVFLAMHRVVIAREEAYLERTFGDAYRAYRRRVRRWI